LFNNLMQHITIHGKKDNWTLKQSARYLILIKEPVKNLKETKRVLEKIYNAVAKKEVS